MSFFSCPSSSNNGKYSQESLLNHRKSHFWMTENRPKRFQPLYFFVFLTTGNTHSVSELNNHQMYFFSLNDIYMIVFQGLVDPSLLAKSLFYFCILYSSVNRRRSSGGAVSKMMTKVTIGKKRAYYDLICIHFSWNIFRLCERMYQNHFIWTWLLSFNT
jgi:hypothetical protein